MVAGSDQFKFHKEYMGRNLQWWPESANIKCLSRTCITRCVVLANFPQQQESEIVKWQWYVAKTLGANTTNVQTTNRKTHHMRWKVWCHSLQLQRLSPCLLAFGSWRFPTPFKNIFQIGSAGNYGLQRSKISCNHLQVVNSRNENCHIFMPFISFLCETAPPSFGFLGSTSIGLGTPLQSTAEAGSSVRLGHFGVPKSWYENLQRRNGPFC